jgi:prepilin-type N-terminal cleavage/methylation domain-containing protein
MSSTAPAILPARARAFSSGFTLFELIAVIGVIAIIAAVAVPQLMPALVMSKHMGESRRLANFGRTAIARSAMMREHYTVVLDLDVQEYWVLRWPTVAELEEKQAILPEHKIAFGTKSAPAPENPQDALAAKAQEMRASFQALARLTTENRARHIRHDKDGIFADAGPMFKTQEFKLTTMDDKDEEKDLRQELDHYLLGRHRFPRGIQMEGVELGGMQFFEGVVEVDVTPLGLMEPVAIFVVNDDAEAYTVKWDAMTGLSHVSEGRQTIMPLGDEETGR